MASQTIYEDNPFELLISEANDDPAQIQKQYESHRVNRNAQQKAKILADDFLGWSLDEVLRRLDGPAKEEGYVDPRNCLVFWARPPPHIREVVAYVQKELREVAPALWLMPLANLHTTVLEVAHSLTESEIQALVDTLSSSKGVSKESISAYPTQHRTRLFKPMVSFDASALALSFAPTGGLTTEAANAVGGESVNDDREDRYTYHHLRRDVFDLVRQTGLPVASRYIAPSAHVTVARFITHDGFQIDGNDDEKQVDTLRVKMLMDKIDAVNEVLKSKYWPQDDGQLPKEGEWIVGQDQGLVVRRGRVWYGGGEDV